MSEDTAFENFAKHPDLPTMIKSSVGKAPETLALMKIFFKAGYALALKWKPLEDAFYYEHKETKIAILKPCGEIMIGCYYGESYNTDMRFVFKGLNDSFVGYHDKNGKYINEQREFKYMTMKDFEEQIK
jgi:hypothetical protein